jgi:hypothetical protein
VTFRHAIFIITAAAVLAYGLLKPHRNWDMVAYVAAAYHRDGYRGEDLSRATYDSVRRTVSSKRFALLTSGRYPGTVFADPASLEQQIPFYATRVAYIGLVRLLGRAGLGYAAATFTISACFAALSVLLLGLIMSRTSVPLGMLPVVAAVTGYTDLARFSTPDAMACFFSLAGVYSLMGKGKAVFPVAAILPLIRTDFILLSALLMGHAYLRGSRLAAPCSLLAAIGLYLPVTRMSGGYGYLTLFNFTFMGSPHPYPADIVISTRPADYLMPYWVLLNDLVLRSHAAIYVVALYLLWLRGGQERARREFYPLLAIPIVFTAGHLLLFPSDQYRFFVFSASLILVWCLHVAQGLRQADPSAA